MAFRTRAGRVVRQKLSDNLAKSVDDFLKSEKRNLKNKRNKLWSVEDVRERRGNEVFVKWKDYGEEFNSWVSLDMNPELGSYLCENEGNPFSSAVANQDLPSLSEEERELWNVRHAVFDELKFRRTPENDTGRSRRVHVKVPFTKRAFSTLFEKGTFFLPEERKLNFSGNRNVKFSCTAEEIASVFGSFSRQFCHSSTICEADPTSKVWVSWGYELRVNYDHSSCPRCTHALECDLCHPRAITYPPIAYLEISFKTRRRNMIHNNGK